VAAGRVVDESAIRLEPRRDGRWHRAGAPTRPERRRPEEGAARATDRAREHLGEARHHVASVVGHFSGVVTDFPVGYPVGADAGVGGEDTASPRCSSSARTRRTSPPVSESVAPELTVTLP
jgi:hypothetical protein